MMGPSELFYELAYGSADTAFSTIILLIIIVLFSSMATIVVSVSESSPPDVLMALLSLAPLLVLLYNAKNLSFSTVSNLGRIFMLVIVALSTAVVIASLVLLLAGLHVITRHHNYLWLIITGIANGLVAFKMLWNFSIVTALLNPRLAC